MTVDEQFHSLLAGHAREVQSLAVAARQLVMSIHPAAHQEVHTTWGGYLLFKQVEGAGNTVCYITAHKKHVSIGLPQGAALADPGGLLEGSGKRQRHVKIKSSADLARPAVRALVEAAWAEQPDAAVLADALHRVRHICLAWPQTSETVSHGHPTFWAGKKTFAVFGLYSPSVAFKADFQLQSELSEDARFFPTPYMARAGWMSLRIDSQTNWNEVRQLLAHSYRQVATPKLRTAFDTGAGLTPING